MKQLFTIALAAATVASCASAPPRNTADICSMFEERRGWYKAAVRAQERWDVPVSVSMAFIEQESGYRARAKPARHWFLGFIPGPRPSSAYGYAQVLDSTWAQYVREAGGLFSSRADFEDAVDFIGWYNHHSYRQSGIARDDAYSLYLAYHEGNGGFQRRTYSDKPWLMDVAAGVQASADRYRSQYQACEKALGRNWFMRLLFS